MTTTETKSETATGATACLLWATVRTGVQVEEKTFETADEAKRYVKALRRRGRTAWIKGDRRYAKIEVCA